MTYARKFTLGIAFIALVSVLLFRYIRTDEVKITVRADVSALRSELQWQFARLESKLHELEHHHKYAHGRGGAKKDVSLLRKKQGSITWMITSPRTSY